MKTLISVFVLVLLALSAMSIADYKLDKGVWTTPIRVASVEDGVIYYTADQGAIFGSIGCHDTNVNVGDVIAHVRLFSEDGDQNMVRLNMQQGIDDPYDTMHIRTCL